MSLELTNYGEIQTALFCRIDVPDYDVLRFSNLNRSFTIDGEAYTALGQLLGVGSTSSEISAKGESVTVAVSGIPNSSIAEIDSIRLKGSSVQIYRAFFDPTTGQLLALDANPTGRFQGIVNNYSLEEDYPQTGGTATNTIQITCTNSVDLLDKKIAGRRTNPKDQKYFYPGDLSMDRVSVLANSNFNFGAVIK
jgi:hypothetical protein